MLKKKIIYILALIVNVLFSCNQKGSLPMKGTNDMIYKQKIVQEPIDLYLEDFSMPQLSHEEIADTRNGIITYIDTDRFRSYSLCSSQTTFDAYEENIQQLYQVTFNDSIVMEKFWGGETLTQEGFVERVNGSSCKWRYGNPFGAFIILDRNTDTVVGYQYIRDNPGVEATGEEAYLFNKAYHRSNTIQKVGYECTAALSLVYGKYLFDNKKMVNQEFNAANKKFEGGQPFKKLQASVRDDHPASQRLLEKSGFIYIRDEYKYKHNRRLFEKVYS